MRYKTKKGLEQIEKITKIFHELIKNEPLNQYYLKHVKDLMKGRCYYF